MSAYYNEFDPYAAQWLRNLIAKGHIAKGDVDERNIKDVKADDLRGYAQCHFFAGIGGWSLALKQAGWDDDRPVWTGSCPCQPFSSAGKGKGFDDERHLWPVFHRLIAECRPSVVFGEQVASKDGLQWLDVVHSDMEASGYAIGAADLCAAGIGSPHIRQRLWFVGTRLADSNDERLEGRIEPGCECSSEQLIGTGGVVDRVANAGDERCDGIDTRLCRRKSRQNFSETDWRSETVQCGQFLSARERAEVHYVDTSCDSCPTNGFWRNADWLFCRDGKWRPVEPGTFPLAHGIPARVGRLRAYGNAICPQVASTFIKGVLECIE